MTGPLRPLALLALVLVSGSAAAPTPAPPTPLLGADWIRYDERPPNCHGPAILVHYHQRSIRGRIRRELAAMRAAGMKTLRLFIYHAGNVRDNESLVSSAGGRLEEPYRTNLANYLDDVRGAGFASLTLTLNPWFENDPIGYTDVPYDPAKLDENWAFIADVRPILKAHGPATTRIDLINEGAPDYWQPVLRGYVSELWRRYADAFGTADVVVSTIVKSDEGGSTSRLQNLIDALEGTGRGLPQVFQVHPSWSGAGALRDLRAIDAVLQARHLDQPLLIGEEAYGSTGVAEGIVEFMRTSQRPVLEVLEWPLESAMPPGGWSRCPSSPYRIDAYARALGGPEPFALAASIVGRRTSLRATDTPVTALGAGTYSVVVVDRSRRDGFRFRLGDRIRQTGVRFRGTKRWRLELEPWTSLRWGSRRGGAQKLVDVLGGGYSD